MATGVAHELNQPLTAISAMAEGILLRQSDGIFLDQDRLEDMMGHILEMVDRMVGIIQHLRVFSRDTSKEPDTQFSLNEVVNESLKMIRAQLVNRGISVELELDADLPNTVGNPRQLEQVCLHLLANARDALEQEAERQDSDWHKRIVIRTQRGEEAILEVEDNGSGIEPEIQARIFEPFFTTKEVDQGKGLGLSISYAIVQNHRGRIETTSRPGIETLFKVILPISG